MKETLLTLIHGSPEIGPVVGGFINQYADWRWSFYVLIIWAVFMWISILTLVPETYHPVLLRRKAIKLRAETGDGRYQAPIEKLTRSITMTVVTSCYRPFQLLLFEPMCLLICLLSAVLLGILYLFFGAFPLVFGVNHGFELWQVGLSFLGIFGRRLIKSRFFRELFQSIFFRDLLSGSFYCLL